MAILAGFLTFVLVLNCLLLILLVLIQLPKKEAGVGAAFGTGTTDVLFGAGSGNALTKITKVSATIFLGISLILSVVNTARASRDGRSVAEQLQKLQGTAPQTATNTAAPTLNLLLNTNAPAAVTNLTATTNPPVAPATPAPNN